MKKFLLQFMSLIIGRKRIEKYHKRKNEIRLRNNGEEVLKAFYRVGEALDVTFIPMFGTLLGAFREHGFIKHDDDIDMSCDIKNLSNELLVCLQKEGFEINNIFVATDKEGVHLPMRNKGIVADIYFMHKDSHDEKIKHIYFPLPLYNDDWVYSSKLNVYSIKDIIIPFNCELVKEIINKTEVEIPTNTDDILKAIYGEDYMTPVEGAHANPPVHHFVIGEKYYTSFPIDVYFKERLGDYIKK